MELEISPSLNVFGEPLQSCSENPLTGYYRDGCCNTGDQDDGVHTVCVEISESFLAFTREKGNDLSTPVPEFDFPGLKAGDRWCICALRWLEAEQQQKAPRVYLASTHLRTIDTIPLSLLKKYALDLM